MAVGGSKYKTEYFSVKSQSGNYIVQTVTRDTMVFYINFEECVVMCGRYKIPSPACTRSRSFAINITCASRPDKYFFHSERNVIPHFLFDQKKYINSIHRARTRSDIAGSAILSLVKCRRVVKMIGAINLDYKLRSMLHPAVHDNFFPKTFTF